MTNNNTFSTFMQLFNVSYVERPKAILAFKRAGFSVDDINTVRTDASHYNMFAAKTNAM
jgi:hypothetical protein